MNSEKITIYIAAYNAERTIMDSIKSINDQKIKFDEIIVIDDKSSDNTVSLIKNLKNIKLIENSVNKGLSYCRNLAFKNTSNNIVASIDSDVVLDNDWLKIMLNEIINKNRIICGGNMMEKFTDNKFNKWRAKYYSQNWGETSINNPPFLFGCNTIQKKELWEKIGGYNENLKSNGEDIDYCLRLKDKGYSTFYCHNAKCYHLQNDSLSSLSNRVWRYHSFGYKIKKISFYRFLKLSIKQINFFIKRSLKDMISLNFNFLIINFRVLINFIYLEIKNVLIRKK